MFLTLFAASDFASFITVSALWISVCALPLLLIRINAAINNFESFHLLKFKHFKIAIFQNPSNLFCHARKIKETTRKIERTFLTHRTFVSNDIFLFYLQQSKSFTGIKISLF
jgi:hypothetical protein